VRCAGDSPTLALVGGPRRGAARFVSASAGRALLSYTAPGATGPDVVVLRATNTSGSATVRQQVTVRPFTMRALGDSVTAGFGYIGDGSPTAVPMGITQLPFCIPPTQLNDRCSSNSANGPSSGGPPSWSADFGLSNDIAWPAQFANARGIGAGAFENRAVSGSAPADWGTGGALNDVLAGIVADDPDLTVLTLGANPLLDTFLAGSGIGCAITLSESAFRACVEGYIAGQQVTQRLGAVIDQLLVAPGNRVVVSQYHLVIPSATIFGVTSLRIMSEELNAAVAAAVQASPEAGERVFLMTPPLFPVGLGPGDALCPQGGSTLVDGQSRQSEPTQDELTVLDPFSFCGSTDYWIISGDTGIHPSQAGHAQFAQALAAVVDANGLMP
jgi:lysophospholipase L1-like esterase